MELQTRIATCPDYGSYNTILEERTGLDFDFIVGRFVPPQPLPNCILYLIVAGPIWFDV